MLITENYGRGRTAVLATGGTWRWQMSQPLEDQTHEEFWQQLLRWLVTDTPGHVTASVPSQMLFDDGRVAVFRRRARQELFARGDAHVEAQHSRTGRFGGASRNDLRTLTRPARFTRSGPRIKGGSYLTDE